jgi:pimeloyl-ACP methyl ester carboxylesterase
MGAATALFYCSKYENANIEAMIIDTSYSKFRETFDFIASVFSIPEFLVASIYKFINEEIQKKGFNLDELNPIDGIAKCTVPALFVYANKDTIVPTTHTPELHDKYPNPDKKIILVDGDHNSIRPLDVQTQIFDYLQKYLC